MFATAKFAMLVGSLFLILAGPVTMLAGILATGPSLVKVLIFLLGLLGTGTGMAGVTRGMDALLDLEARFWAARLNEVERFDLHQEGFYKRFREYGVESRLKD